MSTYKNPIYGNSTIIPYKKLKEEDQPTLEGLISTNPTKNEKYKRQHRIASAGTCIFCALAIILTFLAAILAIYGVFGRCFLADDLDEENFNHFLKTIRGNGKLTGENQRAPFDAPYQRRTLPFPKHRGLMPGPVMHAQCPAMNLLQCDKESFDGYSLQEHQQRVDLQLGKAILNGHLNSSAAVNRVRSTFKQCVKEYDGEKKSIIRQFADELIRMKGIELSKQDISTVLANITAQNRLKFGVDTFFQVNVEANCLAPDGNRPYIMYLDQKLPPSPNVGQMTLMRHAFLHFSEDTYQQIYFNVPKIREMTADSEDSDSWKSFTAAEARARWPFFDFTIYLSELNKKQHFVKNVKEFIFIVKTPTYFDQLNSLFVSKTKNDSHEKLELFKILSIYTLFSEYDKYLGSQNIEDDIRKAFRLNDKLIGSYSRPYHFIYTYENGHASYEALRFCVKELREYLPHIASALHSDLTSELPIRDEIDNFEKLIETVRNELIEWVQESKIGQKFKDILVEKLRKIGVTFTTRESLDKESFEEAHRHLQLDKFDSYFKAVAEIKNFLFKRKLARLNSKIEALRTSAFSEASAASVDIEYSRFGNYLNVPSSVLTSPMLVASLESPRTVVYSNIMWILARELSKSIDSEGVLYNAVGVHKRSETDLTQLEQMWTESQTCLEQHNHHTKLDGTSKAVIIRKSINEMIGFEIAYRTYDKAIDHYLGRKNRNDENWRNTPIKNFFQTSSSVYCLVPQREASIALLDKFVDNFIKKHNILGCTQQFINSFDCNVKLTNY